MRCPAEKGPGREIGFTRRGVAFHSKRARSAAFGSFEREIDPVVDVDGSEYRENLVITGIVPVPH